HMRFSSSPIDVIAVSQPNFDPGDRLAPFVQKSARDRLRRLEFQVELNFLVRKETGFARLGTSLKSRIEANGFHTPPGDSQSRRPAEDLEIRARKEFLVLTDRYGQRNISKRVASLLVGRRVAQRLVDAVC